MQATGELLITPLSAGSAPPIGVVDGVRLRLPDAFEQIVSAAVAEGALTLEAGDLPADCVARVRSAAARLCPATVAGEPTGAGVDSP